MKSIRTQLVLSLVSGTLILIAAAGAGLYGYMEEVLERGLDTALAAKAEAIADAIHMQEDGKPHLQLADPAASPAMHHEGPFYFQIWRDDGSTLARFAPPAAVEMPLPAYIRSSRHFADAKLPDGTWARITALSFFAQGDEDQSESPGITAAHPSAHLLLVVAHDRRSIDGPLAILLTGLLLAAVLTTVGIVVIVRWGVQRGLTPLAELSALADQIGPDSLNIRFPEGSKIPQELRPIGLKLNELLDRLTSAFARERRFSAAVAHELRTPLAELRSACDVALRWPDDAQGLSIALIEAREVTLQMSAMVQTLLALARQQAGAAALLHVKTINLSETVANTWTEFAAVATHHQLTVGFDIDEATVVETDPILLTAILRNLLTNATDYTPTSGHVFIWAVSQADGSLSLNVKNTCQGLTSLDIGKLFEPFWRSDPSRTGSTHAGLGLTLVEAYCKAINVTIDTSLIDPNEIQFTLRFPISTMSPIGTQTAE